jgi:hypothetical protein
VLAGCPASDRYDNHSTYAAQAANRVPVMTARIYKPARNAMQSGTGKTKMWLLEFEADHPRTIEPLMGWTSSSDTRPQVKLWFDTKEEAVSYAERNGIAYRLFEPKPVAAKVLSYADNFKVNRVGQWTH